MKKRKTIGFLVNDLDGNYSSNFWVMMKKAFAKLDCNFFVYEGRSLNSQIGADHQHHIAYNFVDKNRIEGLILTSGTIANYITHSEFVNFCKRFEGIPLISIGVVLPGATSILIDNKLGMKSQVRHLINDHGYKRLAFVTGPKGNIDSIERLDAYREVLSENNIKIDSNLIFNGDFTSKTGYDIMKHIVENDIKYDAIVFANDDMALAAIKCLNDLKEPNNIDMSTKCIMSGFDDTMNSRLVTPSLTTVRQPIEELCYSAVETLIKKIDGEKVDDIITLPSVLVKRESCGCKESNKTSIEDSNVKLVPGYRIHENVQTYLLEELYDCITQALRMCNIRSCFISKYCTGTLLYDEKYVFDDSFTIPQNSELIYTYYNNQRMTIEDATKYFKTKSIVPDSYIPEDRRFTYLVNPLFFNNEHFGFVCFEVVNDDVLNLEPLRGQMSNTLKGALMLLEREKMEESLRETERLASLGQLIGGISHNLMTPIMSISGVCAGLEDLIGEYKESIGDPSITHEDHNDIADDMQKWINKLKEYNSYMSNVIATVKTQTVQLNSDTINEFTIQELVSRIRFIEKNNPKVSRCCLNYKVSIEHKTTIQGDISNLIQIIENLILNSVQSYEGMKCNDPIVDFHIYKEGDCVKFMVKDYGKGISKEIKNKLFKHMVTTKGKNGNGLSLLFSYSTIKGRFGGKIWFESNEDQGTSFYITIPIS